MHSPFFYGVGGVLSADIAVPDHDRVISFYTNILTTGNTPLWRDDLTNSQGTPIIGIGARTPEHEALPTQWMPHFQVADVHASATRTVELGGQELMHAKDNEGKSQWAVLIDPAGAAFGVIPVVADESDDAVSPDRTGCISWLSLSVSDGESIRGFYEQVIGWSSSDAGNDGTHEMLRPDGVAAAEITTFNDENGSTPSVWILHLPVDDLKESLRRVPQGGGEVVRESTAEKLAIIRDPVGVYIALHAYN